MIGVRLTPCVACARWRAPLNDDARWRVDNRTRRDDHAQLSRKIEAMREVCGRTPVATFARTERQLESVDLPGAVRAFVERLHAPEAGQFGLSSREFQG